MAEYRVEIKTEIEVTADSKVEAEKLAEEVIKDARPCFTLGYLKVGTITKSD